MHFNYASISPADQDRLNSFAGAAFSSRQGVAHTFLVAEQAIQENLPGAFVECGVAAGALSATMAYAIQKHGQQKTRTMHLFDSFEGIPYAGPRDVDQPGFGKIISDQNLPLSERLKTTGVSVGTAEQVKNNMSNWGLNDVSFVYHQGWFQHTMPSLNIRNSIGQIAVLRLDGDLYESTECCLKWLYPYLVPGGYVIHDDFPMLGSRMALEDYFRENPPLPQLFLGVDTGAAVWQKSAA